MSDNDVQTTMKKAREILRGVEAEPKDILNDAKKLKNASQFGLGRKLLARVRERPIEDADLRLRLAQLHALCTYKDPDLPAKSKLRDALQILREIDDLETTEDQETLGLAGSIHKRMWELDARRHHLEKSLVYYHRGYEVGPEKDIGYTSINAAYVLDLLASTEEAEARGDRSLSEVANSRREEARTIRERIVSILPSLMEEDDGEWLARKWWYFATLAEAYLGLEDYGEAKKWIARGRRALPDIPEWELESTATQLAALARLQIDDPDNLEGSPAWDVLKELLGDNADAIRGVFSGKLGLGLSGGGFRASLFHIGVLAKLAELDLLRHVHVLSCVSGGSILGAHYYLELRKLLQEKEDSEITREDYEELVARVAKDFLAGVQRNPRTRVAANPWANLKMLFSSTYSRTERVGELFERDIYSRVNDGEGDRERWINDLFIHPKGTKEFAPKRDNWKRRNKVPMLVLNATTLNTGHSWQFTASWMGESPAAIDPDVDGNSRLRRMYYHEAPRAHRKIRLGVAVGASACVPGLFEPIALRELYPGMTVRLVDGGVHDNQGIASLLEQDCTVLLVSDASGQMNTDLEPKGGIIGPLLRTNSVLMGRVRQAQFQDLSARLDASLLKGLMTVHLKKDLDVDSVEWTDCEEPKEEPMRRKLPLTRYGLRKDLQELIAGVRTDLDSFSEVEAFALMTSGYRQTETFVSSIQGFPQPQPSTKKWQFLEIEKPLKQISGVERAHEQLKKLLAVAKQRAFKIWRLSPVLKSIAIGLGIAIVGAIAWAWWKYPSHELFDLTVSDVGWAAASLLAAFVGLKILIELVRYEQTIARVAIALGVGLVGWIVARLHLWLFDPWFLQRGRLSRIFR